MAKAKTETHSEADEPTYIYGTREAWLGAFVALATPAYAAQGLAMPDKIRVSIGWPSSGIRSKTIGECWVREASGDGHAEIFVTPSLKDPERIAGVLTHELVHAIVGHDAKHGPVFKKAAVSMGLEGKMTATTEGPAWHAWADEVLHDLGPYPGSDLTGRIAGGKKKQTTRMLKVTCPHCGLTARLARKWIDAAKDVAQEAMEGEEDEDGNPYEPAGLLRCPMPDHEEWLVIEEPEEGGEE